MPIKTKRWNDPVAPEDGFRLLVCRYRPRGVRKTDETWHAWNPHLGPSRELHAALYGKAGEALPFAKFRRKYVAEMKAQAAAIADLAMRSDHGETITLLCSSACVDPAQCHRTILAELIHAQSRRHSEGV